MSYNIGCILYGTPFRIVAILFDIGVAFFICAVFMADTFMRRSEYQVL